MSGDVHGHDATRTEKASTNRLLSPSVFEPRSLLRYYCEEVSAADWLSRQSSRSACRETATGATFTHGRERQEKGMLEQLKKRLRGKQAENEPRCRPMNAHPPGRQEDRAQPPPHPVEG
jgi:hypothetical protein